MSCIYLGLNFFQFFFLVSLSKVLSILLPFQRINFCLFFYFLFYLLFTLIFIIPFVCFGFSLHFLE